MTSAVASNLPAAAAVAQPAASSSPYGWLGPRVSFSRDAAAAAAEEEEPEVVTTSSSVDLAAVTGTPEPAISKDFIDFEFSFGGAATMLPADELFADGKLLPLRKEAPLLPDPVARAATLPPARKAAMPARPAQAEAASVIVKPLRAAAVAAVDGGEHYVFSPKAPSCSSRWRELLGLKRASAAQSPNPKQPSPSPFSAAARTPGPRAANSAAARSLKLLLQRSSTGCRASSDLSSAPLLRDSSDSEASLSLASSRFSLSSSSSSSGGHGDHDDLVPQRLSLDSSADPNPPRLRLVRASNHRHSTSSAAPSRTAGRSSRPPSPPPQGLSADSPRMNASGKIVFQSLERSSSSPCSFQAASKSRSSRAAVDRSYSSGVRAAPPVVLNVPVCSRPVFGFFKDKKDSSAAAGKDSTPVGRTRSSLGRKASQGWSGELPRSAGC